MRGEETSEDGGELVTVVKRCFFLLFKKNSLW